MILGLRQLDAMNASHPHLREQFIASILHEHDEYDEMTCHEKEGEKHDKQHDKHDKQQDKQDKQDKHDKHDKQHKKSPSSPKTKTSPRVKGRRKNATQDQYVSDGNMRL